MESWARGALGESPGDLVLTRPSDGWQGVTEDISVAYARFQQDGNVDSLTGTACSPRSRSERCPVFSAALTRGCRSAAALGQIEVRAESYEHAMGRKAATAAMNRSAGGGGQRLGDHRAMQGGQGERSEALLPARHAVLLDETVPPRNMPRVIHASSARAVRSPLHTPNDRQEQGHGGHGVEHYAPRAGERLSSRQLQHVDAPPAMHPRHGTGSHSARVPQASYVSVAAQRERHEAPMPDEARRGPPPPPGAGILPLPVSHLGAPAHVLQATALPYGGRVDLGAPLPADEGARQPGGRAHEPGQNLASWARGGAGPAASAGGVHYHSFGASGASRGAESERASVKDASIEISPEARRRGNALVVSEGEARAPALQPWGAMATGRAGGAGEGDESARGGGGLRGLALPAECLQMLLRHLRPSV